ncbi:sigma-70 family RNA polymerase sigma factor [Actinoplanes sp. KI2]|uniref:sigma-70 family RNA polymerase sigma factor n=1 Tax=Actinoplanes sp. KI2 TaxID=2983315 RepID=UPI0021D596F5|nr:sigma-70 family RNA polymerase sigma factor [Actinoplanes sp. KI2]MCU7730920.1 sigma-70 family RNA polymerase sigma factor [Actinoplanes sp. KI2]
MAPAAEYEALEAEIISTLQAGGVTVEPDAPPAATTEATREVNSPSGSTIAPGGRSVPAIPAQAGTETVPAADERIAVDHDAAVAAARDLLRARRWMRDPSRYVLTAEQEVGLALLMRPADMELAEELPEDFRRRLPDDAEPAQAFDALITHNVRLAWSITRRHLAQAVHMEAEDVAGHAYLGLIRAVQKYDASKGFKFSTYATWWIRQHITRAIMDFDRLIRIPVHLGEKITRTRNAYNGLVAAGIRPSLSRLAAETGFDESEVLRHFQLMQGVVSLDRTIDDSGTTIASLIADEEDGGQRDRDGRELRAEIDKLLGELSEREAEIIRLRMGFIDGEPWTLEEIGYRFSLTRERIRQIEGKALNKLKFPPRRARLEDWA